MIGLTERQAEILDFIRRSAGESGYMPTMREIGRKFGIGSTNGVNDHLRALEKKGFIQRDRMKSRAVRLVGGAVVLGSSGASLAGPVVLPGGRSVDAALVALVDRESALLDELSRVRAREKDLVHELGVVRRGLEQVRGSAASKGAA
jgi:SOS-response transcriptional repressor LexA